MINKENSLCFSGHRRERLPKNKKDMRKLKHFLSNEIDNAKENNLKIINLYNKLNSETT